MLEALTSRGENNSMYSVLAGVALDDSTSSLENIQVRKSVVKYRHIILSDIRPCSHLRVTIEV
jgi:hypothetical protein